jgi:hypothetical protein
LDTSKGKKKLREISQALPKETPDSSTPTLQVLPKEGQEQPQESKFLFKFGCWLGDFLLNRKNWPLLTPEEKALLAEPLDEIEIEYLSPLMRKYAGKASPFIQLAMAINTIYGTRKAQEPPKEEAQPEEIDKTQQ